MESVAPLSQAPATESSKPISTRWPIDWDPVNVDNLTSFPDMGNITRDAYEADDFAYVPKLDQNTYDAICYSFKQTSQDRDVCKQLNLSDYNM
jgi:hypothetical protein